MLATEQSHGTKVVKGSNRNKNLQQKRGQSQKEPCENICEFKYSLARRGSHGESKQESKGK